MKVHVKSGNIRRSFKTLDEAFDFCFALGLDPDRCIFVDSEARQ